jgi:hypothetical protein
LPELCAKNEQNRVCKSEVSLQLSISSIFCRKTIASPLGKGVQRGPKLETLTVIPSSMIELKKKIGGARN